MEYINIIKSGHILAVPTETVYGLAADATNASAIAKIYSAKGRPDFNPLIVHVRDLNHAKQYGIFNDTAEKLAKQFWAGALTLVVPLKENTHIAKAVTAGLNTIALRVPAHPIMQKLLQECDCPLAAPSANISGGISPSCSDHVLRSFGEYCPPILEGGVCSIGVESTIIGFEDDMPVLLRAGGIPLEEIEKIVGSVKQHIFAHITAPGQLSSHYAPCATLRLNAIDCNENEAYLAFGNSIPPNTSLFYQLSESRNLAEAASRLYEGLHFLDAYHTLSIAVAPIPYDGFGLAINDRLKRASAPR